MNATETASFILKRIDDPRVIVGPLYNEPSKPVGYQLRMKVTTHKLSEGNLTQIIEFYDTPTQLAQSFRSTLIRELDRLYRNQGLKYLVIQDYADATLEAAAIKELAATGGGGLNA